MGNYLALSVFLIFLHVDYDIAWGKTLQDIEFSSSSSDEEIIYGTTFGKYFRAKNGELPKQLIFLAQDMHKYFGEGGFLIHGVTPNGRSPEAKISSVDHPREIIANGEPGILVGHIDNEGKAQIITLSTRKTGNFYEFLILENYGSEKPLKLTRAPREFCVACHQGGQPIFSVAPWNEFNIKQIMEKHKFPEAPIYDRIPVMPESPGANASFDWEKSDIWVYPGGESLDVNVIRGLEQRSSLNNFCEQVRNSDDLELKKLVIASAISNDLDSYSVGGALIVRERLRKKLEESKLLERTLLPTGKLADVEIDSNGKKTVYLHYVKPETVSQLKAFVQAFYANFDPKDYIPFEVTEAEEMIMAAERKIPLELTSPNGDRDGVKKVFDQNLPLLSFTALIYGRNPKDSNLMDTIETDPGFQRFRKNIKQYEKIIRSAFDVKEGGDDVKPALLRMQVAVEQKKSDKIEGTFADPKHPRPPMYLTAGKFLDHFIFYLARSCFENEGVVVWNEKRIALLKRYQEGTAENMKALLEDPRIDALARNYPTSLDEIRSITADILFDKKDIKKQDQCLPKDTQTKVGFENTGIPQTVTDLSEPARLLMNYCSSCHLSSNSDSLPLENLDELRKYRSKEYGSIAEILRGENGLTMPPPAYKRQPSEEEREKLIQFLSGENCVSDESTANEASRPDRTQDQPITSGSAQNRTSTSKVLKAK